MGVGPPTKEANLRLAFPRVDKGGGGIGITDRVAYLQIGSGPLPVSLAPPAREVPLAPLLAPLPLNPLPLARLPNRLHLFFAELAEHSA